MQSSYHMSSCLHRKAGEGRWRVTTLCLVSHFMHGVEDLNAPAIPPEQHRSFIPHSPPRHHVVDSARYLASGRCRLSSDANHQQDFLSLVHSGVSPTGSRCKSSNGMMPVRKEKQKVGTVVGRFVTKRHHCSLPFSPTPALTPRRWLRQSYTYGE